MLKTFKAEFKKLEGNVLGIGLDHKLSEIIEKNNKIINCDLLENDSNSKGTKSKFTTEIINIKDLKKRYKNKLDCLIINYEVVKKYNNYILKYMNNLPKKETLIYNIENIELYENRLNKLNIEYKKNNNILIIYPNKKSKNKVILYFYMDKINYEIDKLIDILNI